MYKISFYEYLYLLLSIEGFFNAIYLNHNLCFIILSL